MLRWVSLFLAALLVRAADWPMAGGDPTGSNIQPNENILTEKTVRGLTLLWRKHLGDKLSSPVILGHLITHRGFQELIFVTSSHDTVYAIDADLGRVLWERKLDDHPGKRSPVTPAFVPERNDDDDHDQKSRPLFVLSSHSELFALRMINGKDDGRPKQLTASNATALMVNESGAATVRAGGSKPVAANGLVYRLEKKRLVVSKEKTARLVLSLKFDGNVSRSATLAVANGHVAFTTEGGDLYCFGLPFDL